MVKTSPILGVVWGGLFLTEMTLPEKNGPIVFVEEQRVYILFY